MNTYGFHTIHGRAPTIASGLKITRPDLDVWVITGDGDGLSIGGNHMVHVLRRNMDLKIILFNNQIYGLTKGQYSPTSALGTRAPSTPTGSIDHPLNPIALALGAGATFVARAADTDAKLMGKILEEAYQPQGRGVHRDAPELPGVQRRRVGRRQGRPGRQADHRSPRASRSCSRTAPRASSSAPGMVPEIVDVGDGDTERSLVHTESGSPLYAQPARAARPAGLPDADGRPLPPRQADVRRSSRSSRSTTRLRSRAPATSTKLMYSGMVWEVGADGTRH